MLERFELNILNILEVLSHILNLLYVKKGSQVVNARPINSSSGFFLNSVNIRNYGVVVKLLRKLVAIPTFTL